MCGRATLTLPPEDLAQLFALLEVPDLAPRYNIAPTQPIAVVRNLGHLELLRWGLVLPNVEAKGARGINVRVESVARAPSYRDSFRSRRCLVIVDGFYEWKGEGKEKQPFLIRRQDQKAFALAGIWDRSVTEDGEILETCAVITGPAQGVIRDLHDRMPLIVTNSGFVRWLDPSREDIADLLKPSAADLVAHPVSTLVNSPANDVPRCLEEVALRPSNLSLF